MPCQNVLALCFKQFSYWTVNFPVYFVLRIMNNSFTLNNMAPSVLLGQAFS